MTGRTPQRTQTIQKLTKHCIPLLSKFSICTPNKYTAFARGTSRRQSSNNKASHPLPRSKQLTDLTQKQQILWSSESLLSSQQNLWTCSCSQAAAAPLNHHQSTLRRYSILLTSLFTEKRIARKREGYDSLLCIRLIPFSPTGQGENKAWAGPVAAKAPSGHPVFQCFPPGSSTEKRRLSLETAVSPNSAKLQTSHPSSLPGSAPPGLCSATRPPPHPRHAGEPCTVLGQHELLQAAHPNRTFTSKAKAASQTHRMV